MLIYLNLDEVRPIDDKVKEIVVTFWDGETAIYKGEDAVTIRRQVQLDCGNHIVFSN